MLRSGMMDRQLSSTMAVERVSDYPRPPRVEIIQGEVRVELGGETIATTNNYVRVCETYHPPTIYLPPNAFQTGCLHASAGRPSFCEWKGIASYWSLSKADGTDLRTRAAWSYPSPTPSFAPLAGWISLYPAKVDVCWLEGERVTPQPGSFYGGWITEAVLGPFKGDPLHPELI